MHPKNADSIANSAEPDQTAQSVQKLRIIMVMIGNMKTTLDEI